MQLFLGWLLSGSAESPSLSPLKTPLALHSMGSHFMECAGCTAELLVQTLGQKAVRRGIREQEQALLALSQPVQLRMEAVHCAAGREACRKLAPLHETHTPDLDPEWVLYSPAFPLVWM